MAVQPSSNDLPPQLQAVLCSLNVTLEAELNRYRRNRAFESVSAEHVFSSLEDKTFEVEEVDLEGLALKRENEHKLPAMAESSKGIAFSPTPPPLPPNRRLHSPDPAEQQQGLILPQQLTAEFNTAPNPLEPSQDPTQVPAVAIPASALMKLPLVSGDSGVRKATEATSPGLIGPNGYLASSEKLIESLSEVPSLPEPIDTTFRPKKRKAVSLLAGASLGFFGLAAGLGASYLMSNPLVAQRLVSGFKGESSAIATLPKSKFDPPGPDLSAKEFIDLELDNLSSLKMPQTAPALNNQSAKGSAEINPGSLGTASPAVGLPPIGNSPSGIPAPQAVAIPTGGTYYVTIPFTTEQGLLEVRKVVDEAFVRQFTDGNRIQLAAFDNFEAAQQQIEELKSQGVVAQVYGPTHE